MSERSPMTTRGQLRKLTAEKRRREMEERTDSGLHTTTESPSATRATASVSTSVIPAAGGHDHGTFEPPPVLEPDRSTTQKPRRSSRSSQGSSRSSRRNADYLRKLAEYEAERELLRMRESVVKKKLEADLAKIDDEASSSDGESTTRRVEDWVNTTPQQVLRTEVAPHAPSEYRETLAARAPQAPHALSVSDTHDKLGVCTPPVKAVPRALRESFVPDAAMRTPRVFPVTMPVTLSSDPRSRMRDVSPELTRNVNSVHFKQDSPFAEESQQRQEDRRRDTSYDRKDRGIEQLAEAISKLARPRPVPRQAYELPIFTGDPSDWISFKNMYWDTSAMYEFKPHENLARLKTSLQGEAKSAVEDLLRSSYNPSEIMKALEEEFGHPNLVLECALEKIRGLPKVSESGKELRKFSTSVRNCVSLLKNIRADGYLNNPQLVSELLNKLTPVQRAQYGDFAMGLDHMQGVDLRVSPSLEIFSDFLAHLSRAASYYVQMNVTTAVPSTSAARFQKNVHFPAVRRTQYTRPQKVNVQSEKTVSPKDNIVTQMDTKFNCALCQGEHLLVKCKKFADLSVDERWDFTKVHKLCFKCLIKKHSKSYCKAKRCEKCSFSHHVLLHSDKVGENVSESVTESVTNVGESYSKALLKVLPVTITNVNGEKRNTECYALLDDGATVSLLDSSIAGELKGPKVPLVIKSARGHEVSDLSSRVVTVQLQGPNGQCHKLVCRTLVRMDLPTQTVPAATIEDNAHLRDLGCEEMRNAKPLLLLGQDNWELLVSQDIRRGKSGKPVASLTKLGWVIHGRMSSGSYQKDYVNCMAVSLPDLHEVVKAQFALEAIGISEDPRKHRNVERAIAILDKTSRRTHDGTRWEVGLLWKQDNIELPDNYKHARQRLEGIERKMDRNPAFAEAYTKQVERLVSEGYARKVDDGLKTSPVWYLPHFGVVNPNKPGKLRLVFDAASTFQGTCLNDNLLTGPDLLNSLLGVLMKFRLGPIAFSGDIADMFLRIQIRKEDQGAQLFLWRGADRKREPEIYAMNSMIFGAVSSPTTAIYILNKNAGEYKKAHPEAVAAVQSKQYMDDYLDSAWTVDDANKLIEEVTKIHLSGGFVIRGWTTNSPELREKLQAEMPERVSFDKGEDFTERTLGMIWSAKSDHLAFDLSFKRLPEDIVSGKVIPTKREFLRFIMSIFDPLGFLYPCIIQSRILMQKVWKSGIQWDERLNESEAAIWLKWLNNLQTLHEIAIPRWYGLQLDELELHVFGDASELAYAAVAYPVGRNADGEREISMVIGKARVAPQKVVSIPRLELKAAVLASRLACTVEKELGVEVKRKFLWTDSKTVLKWIFSDAQEFQRFVSHRLSEIDRRSHRSNWRWVPSAENPADKATRWNWPSDCDEWLSGPSFLRDPQERWPACDGIEAREEDLERTQKVHITSTSARQLLDEKRFASWTRCLRVMGRVLIFIGRCRKRRTSVELLADDLHEAELRLLKIIQAESFNDELNALRKGLQLAASSKLRTLDPMLYDDGLLRVRGRLEACQNLSFGERHPIILDGRHPLTRKLIHQYHATTFHANQETVVNNIREKYWVTNLRSTVKVVVSSCQLCRIRKAKPITPKMGDLPTARLEVTKRAFIHAGVDYFGPMEVAVGRHREKRWGVLFTCLTTRAVHLELATSLSSDSAILALRRLIARRGHPSHLYSDRGTNFVGANTELRAALKELNHDQVNDEATTKGIQWHFNPPASSHMGGCWERLVRSVKNALKFTLKERCPREDVLYTLLTEAELVINSRPLSYVTSDSDQPVVLTPNHLLLGTASDSTSYARQDFTDIDARRQWKRVNALADVFWRRWLREYLPTLQQQNRWLRNVPDVKLGDVVIIVDETKDRNRWTKGIIKAVYHGHDSVIRVVDVSTVNGVLRRPVVKIVVLPTNGDVIG